MAYKVFIAPALMFVGQLEGLPDSFLELERRAMEALLPGPRFWMSPSCLKHFKTLHFPLEFPDIVASCKAAKCRVSRFDSLASGGLRINARAKKLSQTIVNSASNDGAGFGG